MVEGPAGPRGAKPELERELVRAIRLAVGSMEGVVLWRNQVGSVESEGRWQRYGLVKGASDLIGLVAPYGRFLALEVKTKRGRVRPEQQMFLDLVNRMGGVGRVVRSVEEALEAVRAARCSPG